MRNNEKTERKKGNYNDETIRKSQTYTDWNGNGFIISSTTIFVVL